MPRKSGGGGGGLESLADALVSAIERRLSSSSIGSGGGGGGGASFGGPPPASALGGGGGFGGAIGQIGLAALQGAGQGVASTPSAAINSPDVLAQNMTLGAVGGVLSNTVGNIPVLGDWIMGNFNAVNDAVHTPANRASAAGGRFHGDLAAMGYDVSDSDMRKEAARGLETERRRYSAERRFTRHVEEVNAGSSISYGLSLIGL